ncbi:MAG: hypothetical protein Q8K36_05415 [Alphaproteobacteria bacterium]|nr:hypothetical protein [Alphaproteobacteria bacterium]
MSPQLPQTLIKNSFNIFGLSTAATLKEIRQRYQQLLQFAKIEEMQDFETDIGYVREFRNENELKVALERISGIKSRLREIFFWLDDHNKENKEAVVLIARGALQDAIDILDKTDRASLDWLRYKNLALAFLFQAFNSDDLNSFFRSLELWKNILESEDFWKFYEKHYLLHDELGTSSSLFRDFRDEIYEYLSDQTVSFYHKTKNPKILGIYYRIFSQLGKSIDISVVQPVVYKIKKEIADLEKIVPDGNEKTLIKSLKKINKHFLELDKFEVSEYSPFIILRNESAEKLMHMSIYIYNQSDNADLSKLFLEQSARLAVSNTLVRTIEANKEEINNIEEDNLWGSIAERFDKIKKLIQNNEIISAKDEYLNLDGELAAHDQSICVRARLLIEFCSLLMDKGDELFNHKIFGISTPLNAILYWKKQKDAIYIFEMTHEIITNKIYFLYIISDIFSILDIKVDIQHIKETIEKASNDLKSCDIGSLSDLSEVYDNQLTDMMNECKETTIQRIIALLGSSEYCGVIYRRVRSAMYIKIGKFIGIAFFVFMICDSRNTSSSLSMEEKEVIAYLEKTDPELLKSIRKDGYSDKKIARYVIEHAHREKKGN